MKAIVITEFGDPSVLQLTEERTPGPGPFQVLIEVMAAGVNRPDIFQRKGNYPPPPDVPQHIPGLEVAGIVSAVGESVSRWKKGDKVCALLPGGGYAEFALADENSCLPIHAGLSFNEAAAIPETVFTVWSTVFMRAHLQPGETLLVHGGSSGIGTTAIQLAVALGSKVFATAGSEEKCRVCRDLEATGINYKTQDFAAEIGSEGVDVILDMIGGDYFARNIDVLKPEGRLVFINAMKGPTAELKIRDIMNKRLTITGSTLRSRELAYKAEVARAVEQNVWPLLKQGSFKPLIDRTFSLADAAKAHAYMEEGSHIGKIVLTVKD